MEYLIYLSIGVIAGLLAGLLGIGGGLVIVPALLAVYSRFTWQSDQLMQIALGTSLATIIFTSVSSVWAHHQRGAVQWDIVKRLSVGILLGALIGGFTAQFVAGKYLQYFFALFELYVAIQMFHVTTTPKVQITSTHLPSNTLMIGAGIVIGKISSLLGIGGGTLTVPFLYWHNIDLHKAIASSAACGIPIAIAGTIGYIIGGWNQPYLPQPSLGYIYLPSMISITISSMLFAPLGVKISHQLPVNLLKKIFSGLLIILSAYMFIK